MDIIIREEQVGDYSETEKVVEKAFANEAYSDHDEHHLVSRLRSSEEYIPQLSLVAVTNDSNIVGHILLTKIRIINGSISQESLALAPISVLPEYQRKGIGKQLIELALKNARDIGYQSVIVMGHSEYYPKFGFKKASNWGIKPPFDVPDHVFMAKELRSNALDDVSGVVEYSSAFDQ